MRFFGWNLTRGAIAREAEREQDDRQPEGTALAAEPLEPVIPEEREEIFRPDFLEDVRTGFRLWFNEEEFGCAPYTNCIAYRAARTYDSGFSCEFADNSGAEQEFVNELIKRNKLRGTLGQWCALLGEIQGQVAFQFRARQIDGKIELDAVPLINLRKNYYDYFNTSYEVRADGSFANFLPEESELIILSGIWRFDARNKTAITPPRLAKGFKYCRGLDRAQSQIEKVNELYARPTLVTEHKDLNDKNSFLKWVKGVINDVKWKLGQMLQLVKTGGGAAAYFIQPDTSGVVALETQARDNIRHLSTLSGAPPQKFGYPDLQSNRSVADHSEDAALYEQSRTAWEEGLLSIFQKAIRMSNNAPASVGRLDPEKLLAVNMTSGTPELKWAVVEQLREDFKAGLIPREFYLQKHPEVKDASALETEMLGQDARRAAALADALRQPLDDGEENGQ